MPVDAEITHIAAAGTGERAMPESAKENGSCADRPQAASTMPNVSMLTMRTSIPNGSTVVASKCGAIPACTALKLTA